MLYCVEIVAVLKSEGSREHKSGQAEVPSNHTSCVKLMFPGNMYEGRVILLGGRWFWEGAGVPALGLGVGW